MGSETKLDFWSTCMYGCSLNVLRTLVIIRFLRILFVGLVTDCDELYRRKSQFECGEL